MKKYYSTYRNANVKLQEEILIGEFTYELMNWKFTLHTKKKKYHATNFEEFIKVVQKVGSRKQDGYVVIWMWDCSELLHYVRATTNVLEEFPLRGSKKYYWRMITGKLVKKNGEQNCILYKAEFRSICDFDALSKGEMLEKYEAKDEYECLRKFLKVHKKDRKKLAKIRVSSVAEAREKIKDELCYELWSDGRKHETAFCEKVKCNFDLDTYAAVKTAYQGGCMTLQRGCEGKIIRGVAHWDLDASHISNAILQKFPDCEKVWHYENLTKEELLSYLHHGKFGGVATVTFRNLALKDDIACGILIKREGDNAYVNAHYRNGNICNADRVTITITTQEFKNILKIYDAPQVEVHELWLWKMNYLPWELTVKLIEVWKNKTQFKHVKGKEAVYELSKLLVVNFYGSMGMQPDEFLDLTNLTQEEKLKKIEECINEYNAKPKLGNILWAAFIVDYSRGRYTNLMEKLKLRHLNGNTDGMCVIDDTETQKLFAEANAKFLKFAASSLAERDMTLDNITAYSENGEKHTLGMWENDYTGSLCALGKGAYMVEKSDGELELKCNGLTKSAVKYLEKIGGLKAFKVGLTIPEEFVEREGRYFSSKGFIIKKKESFTLGQNEVNAALQAKFN